MRLKLKVITVLATLLRHQNIKPVSTYNMQPWKGWVIKGFFSLASRGGRCNLKLQQLERLCSEDTPPPPHDYPYHWVKFFNFETGITRDTPSEVAW